MTAQLDIQFDAPKASRKTQKDRVLAMLRAQEWVTNVDFLNAVPRLPNFRSRLSELRKEGHQIVEGQYVQEGIWRYRLIREGE
jgi:hypothetical protein